MTTYDFVHLVLYAAGGEIRGRTKLQKLVYFVGALTGTLENWGYKPHYYGPFSPEVAGAVDQLRGLRFLEQRALSGGAIDPQGFEVSRYDYTLTDDGKDVALDKTKEYPQECQDIQDAVKKLKDANAEDYVKLSIAAKAFFLAKQNNGTTTLNELLKKTPTFGWQITKEQMREADLLLKSLGLFVKK